MRLARWVALVGLLSSCQGGEDGGESLGAEDVAEVGDDAGIAGDGPLLDDTNDTQPSEGSGDITDSDIADVAEDAVADSEDDPDAGADPHGDGGLDADADADVSGDSAPDIRDVDDEVGNAGSDDPGHLVFHRYSSYDAWDSELFLVDLSDHSITHLSAAWEIDHAMNAHFSPDGTRIVFMGDQASGDRDWDVFVWTLGSDEPPENLTEGWGTRDEDPKFSPDGTVVLKSNFDLIEIDIEGSVIRRLTDDGSANEESMPFFSADGTRVIYARGARASSDLRLIGRDGSGDTAVQALPDIQEYYPIVRDAESYFFTRWVSAANVHDQVYLGYLDGTPARSLALNDEENNYSDAFPYGEDALFFSSTRAGGAGGYDLYLADVDGGIPVSLSDWNPAINTELEELGAAFSP